jgi:hypothetical protein
MTDYPPLDKIPLVTYDKSDDPKPKFSLIKSTSVDTRIKRLRFLEYAADIFKEEYKTFYNKDSEKFTFPSKAVWKAYLEDIKKQSKVQGFLTDKASCKYDEVQCKRYFIRHLHISTIVILQKF